MSSANPVCTLSDGRPTLMAAQLYSNTGLTLTSVTGNILVSCGPTEDMGIATKSYVDTHSGTGTLADLTDVSLDELTLANNDALKYNSKISKWVNATNSNHEIGWFTHTYSGSVTPILDEPMPLTDTKYASPFMFLFEDTVTISKKGVYKFEYQFTGNMTAEGGTPNINLLVNGDFVNGSYVNRSISNITPFTCWGHSIVSIESGDEVTVNAIAPEMNLAPTSNITQSLLIVEMTDSYGYFNRQAYVGGGVDIDDPLTFDSIAIYDGLTWSNDNTAIIIDTGKYFSSWFWQGRSSSGEPIQPQTTLTSTVLGSTPYVFDGLYENDPFGTTCSHGFGIYHITNGASLSVSGSEDLFTVAYEQAVNQSLLVQRIADDKEYAFVTYTHDDEPLVIPNGSTLKLVDSQVLSDQIVFSDSLYTITINKKSVYEFHFSLSFAIGIQPVTAKFALMKNGTTTIAEFTSTTVINTNVNNVIHGQAVVFVEAGDVFTLKSLTTGLFYIASGAFTVALCCYEAPIVDDFITDNPISVIAPEVFISSDVTVDGDITASEMFTPAGRYSSIATLAKAAPKFRVLNSESLILADGGGSAVFTAFTTVPLGLYTPILPLYIDEGSYAIYEFNVQGNLTTTNEADTAILQVGINTGLLPPFSGVMVNGVIQSRGDNTISMIATDLFDDTGIYMIVQFRPIVNEVVEEKEVNINLKLTFVYTPPPLMPLALKSNPTPVKKTPVKKKIPEPLPVESDFVKV